MASSDVSRPSGRFCNAVIACSRIATASRLAGARGRLGAGLAKIGHRLRPHLAPEGVIGQHLGLLGAPLRVQSALDGGQDARVQRAPPLTAGSCRPTPWVRAWVEAVLQVGEEAGLEQELRLLEPREPRAERLLRHLHGGGEQGEGHVLSDDRGGACRSRFSSGPRRSMRGGDDGLDGGGHLDGGEGLTRRYSPLPPPAPGSRPASVRTLRERMDCPRCAR